MGLTKVSRENINKPLKAKLLLGKLKMSRHNWGRGGALPVAPNATLGLGFKIGKYKCHVLFKWFLMAKNTY